jgi:hypothetical protein
MKYIKVTRSDVSGSYTMPVKDLITVIDSEFDDIEFYDAGTQIQLTVVEMNEEEYNNAPEFEGW